MFIISFLIAFELIIFLLVFFLKKDFQWLITSKDDFPFRSQQELDNFLKTSFSRELGWDRKPLTKGIEKIGLKKTSFEITKKGYRKSPNNYKINKVGTFGDSYAFCRYVNNNQTWQFFLEKKIKKKVLNFGVGNYGLDQSFLKYEEKKNKTMDVIVFCVVPETISRIHSYWKHYLEFGNKFGFKPLFKLTTDNKLIKINNYLKGKKSIEQIRKNISFVKDVDIFFKRNFQKKKMRFPHTLVYLRNISFFSKIFFFLILNKLTLFFKGRDEENYFNKAVEIVIKQNIKNSNYLYKDSMFTKLFEKLVIHYQKKVNDEGKKFVLLIIPQIHDLKLKKNRKNFYQKFFSRLSEKIDVLDLTNDFYQSKNFEKYYIRDNYAGHLSPSGNQFVSNLLFKYFKCNGFIK